MNWRNLDFVDAIRPPSRESPLSYGRHAIAAVARRTDEPTARARAELVREVRKAAERGVTQTDIAGKFGRSQPEVSHLPRFQSTSPLGRVLRGNAVRIRRLVADSGGRNVRVFGSVATSGDRPDSDVDLLFEMRSPLSLLQLARLEESIAALLGVPVDLVPDGALRPDLRERVTLEAVRL